MGLLRGYHNTWMMPALLFYFIPALIVYVDGMVSLKKSKVIALEFKAIMKVKAGDKDGVLKELYFSDGSKWRFKRSVLVGWEGVQWKFFYEKHMGQPVYIAYNKQRKIYRIFNAEKYELKE